jgi:hypothetical protein
MARPSHKPDDVHRRQVEALAGFGIPEADIAGLIGIDAKTLRKHYRHELDFGHTKANAKVAENLFRKATGDGRESVTAAIFWLKARARWKEISINEHTGLDGKPIEQVHEIRRIIISASERATGLPGSPALPSPDSVQSAVIWEAPSR